MPMCDECKAEQISKKSQGNKWTCASMCIHFSQRKRPSASGLSQFDAHGGSSLMEPHSSFTSEFGMVSGVVSTLNRRPAILFIRPACAAF